MRRWVTAALILIASVVVSPDGAAEVVSPQPHGPGGAWRLVWGDEFTGDRIDPGKWQRPVWHVQNVDTDPANAWVYAGRLVLNLASSTRGALVRSTFQFQPGMVAEARVKLTGDDHGDPIFNWPGWWASGIRYPDSGEHDIAEGLRAGLKVSYWDGAKTIRFGRYPPGDWNGYHTYTLYRGTTHALVWWDGRLVGDYPTNDDGGPEALLLSLGSTPGETSITGMPGRVRIDWVRVWQR